MKPLVSPHPIEKNERDDEAQDACRDPHYEPDRQISSNADGDTDGQGVDEHINSLQASSGERL
jgi:hypothetical protein